MRTVLLGMLLLAAQAVWAAETGTALKAETLRAKPFADAKAVASLAAGAKVSILKKDGGWLQVKSGKSTGWVRMLSIRKGEARKAGSDTAGLLNLASGRAGTGKVVATTGVRGLNEEELKAAKFDEKEVEKAESYATSGADAQRFASQGKLKTRQFDYLPQP
ncbi:MAG TPA: SH3 domain-containing protein [Gallionellaceae bacterium]